MNDNIKQYILNHLTDHNKDIVAITSKGFSVSRQSVAKHLKKLIDEGLISAVGNTRARQYGLRNFVDETYLIDVTPDLKEDREWREKILPHMKGVLQNVLDICQYGFTEMLRNVIDHSGASEARITTKRNAVNVELIVGDHGVGIFNKIQADFGLDDPRHALLELSKGKLTSDSKKHSGEGIFFTSRMFDSFTILSNPLFYARTRKDGMDDWLIEVENRDSQKGTFVIMEISPNANHTVKEVFDRYAPTNGDYGFTRTHVPIKLARYEGEQLVSRSQARRLLARFERFKEVLLDFQGVTTIGQAFADEIFRVYRNEHPNISIHWVNTAPDVDNMISRAMGHDKGKG